jgi:hypothetical protein
MSQSYSDQPQTGLVGYGRSCSCKSIGLHTLLPDFKEGKRMTFVKAVFLATMPVMVAISTVEAAPNRALSHVAASPTIAVKCIGNHRNYVGFNHCMRLNPRGLRYCNRICGTGS